MQSPITPDNGTPPPRFRVDDLEVDVGKAEVTRGDEEIALPKLSFDLLCALIKAAPAIVTNDELLQQVWPGLQVSPESVAQRVKLLRSAIGDDSQQPKYILGVRGRGYRLIPAVERCDVNLPSSEASNQPVNPASATIRDLSISQSLTPTDSNGRPKRAVIAAAVLVAVGAVVGLGWRFWSSGHKAAEPTVAMLDRSIAVLPFVDMSEKKDQEYFGDGMAEEIIDLMGKIPGLRVIGRTSSFAFKGKSEDLRSIAKQLGVAYVLEGSVRKSGDRMRVTAQLIDSHNGTSRWSQTYDRDFSEVLKLQDEIATRVVREVNNDATFSYIVSRKTLRNPEAYTAFLQGIHANELSDSEQALTYYQRALDLDPSFADAASVLAGTYLFMGQTGSMPPAVAFEKARNTAALALKLDPNQSAAHQVLSDIHLIYDWDWPAAERELNLAKAFALEGLGSTQGDSSQLALTLGRFDEALTIANKSVADDPLDPVSYLWLSVVELRRGRLAEGEAAIRRSLELGPAFKFSHYILAGVLIERGEPEAALVESLRERIEGFRLGGSAMAYFALGRRPESDAALARALKSYGPYTPYGIAGVYAFRGESDEAFTWLERAYAQRDPLLYQIKFWAVFDRLHDDPRYNAFLKKMNLPE